MGSRKTNCPKCLRNVRIKGLLFFKGEMMCPNCFKRATTIIGGPCPEARIKIDDAQEKVRSVRTYFNKSNNSTACQVHVPSCYSGKDVRVILVDDDTRLNPDGGEAGKIKPLFSSPPSTFEEGTE